MTLTGEPISALASFVPVAGHAEHFSGDSASAPVRVTVDKKQDM